MVETRNADDRRRNEAAHRRSEDRFRLLSRTANRLLESKDPQAVVDELCREVMCHLDCQVFLNYLFDDACGCLQLNAWAGIDAAQATRVARLGFGETICGCVARDGCRMIAGDLSHSSAPGLDHLRSCGVQAYCCHPLMAQGRVIGTLAFGTVKRAAFAADEIEVMGTVADQVSVAMQRVETERDLRMLNITLDQRVTERTAEAVALADQLRALASELTRVEQRERRRLATVLHDHLQQMLVAAQMRLGLLRRESLGDGALAQVECVEAILKESIQAARSLTVELSPPVLHEAGLAVALAWLANRMREKNGFEVDFRAEKNVEPASLELRVLLFEATRELLFNALKHSGVLQARVTLATVSRAVVITIEDAGRGFEPAEWRASDRRTEGFGLFSIEQRLAFLGGRMAVTSTPGAGTRIVLTAPPEARRARPPRGFEAATGSRRPPG